MPRRIPASAVASVQAWTGTMAVMTIVAKNDWSLSAEAREKDPNDVRVPDNTMMDTAAHSQCDIWVTRCKIDDTMPRRFRGCE